MAVKKDSERAAEHWDEHAASYSGRKTGLFFWEVDEVMRQLNRRISGDPELEWQDYTLQRHFAGRLPLERCLSLGCGTGELERKLARAGAFRACDACDVSATSLQMAEQAAAREGFEIGYFQADANLLELAEDRYDAVWAYGALHHFRNLEHVSRQIRSSLKREGLLCFLEYVGPSRFQFPERQKEIVNLCLQLLPRRYRALSGEALAVESRKIEAQRKPASFLGRLKGRLIGSRPSTLAPPTGTVFREEAGFPSAQAVVADDPSESVRSQEILEVIQRDFEIAEQREAGGNVFQFLLSGIAANFSDEDPCSTRLVRMLTEVEEALIACGELQSDLMYVVARPRP